MLLQRSAGCPLLSISSDTLQPVPISNVTPGTKGPSQATNTLQSPSLPLAASFFLLPDRDLERDLELDDDEEDELERDRERLNRPRL